ncbi:MAG: DUF1802 family protein [Symploca sp. SIO3C6]|nr:DUF1802 family protein [Symploca sp. SIO3C6]
MLIQTALRVPAPEIEALIEGRMIVIMPRVPINPGRQFALYPSVIPIKALPIEKYYRSDFLPTAQKTIADINSETVVIKAWARCEFCPFLDASEACDILSQLTVWTKEALEQILKQPGYKRLAYLRVYRLPQPWEMPVPSNSNPNFIPLERSLDVSETTPVLNEHIFARRRRQLENRQLPLYPELEQLHSAITQLCQTNHAAQELNQDIKQLLGWANEIPTRQLNPDLAWINDITALGDRSKELDTGKSNYQAGTDFENIVRNSLKFLGFTIDYSHKGGAGGLDLFCSQPYPLVGECKAGKKVPNNTAVQLLNLGTIRLNDEQLLKQTTKLIIGPGEPTKQLKEAATLHGMAIINPETLEKLVKLQSKYPNSIDLFKLKNYLKPGQTDDEVENYIAQVSREIELRSHLVALVKNYLENANIASAEISALHAVYVVSNPLQPLTAPELHEILIELSSPLTGYLGRIKGSDGKSDRFYFLRDLPNNIEQ